MADLMTKLNCGVCGNPIENIAEACLKCGEKRAVRQDGKRFLDVDVAHAGETVEGALAKLNQAASEALAGAYQGLRVVHGCGSEHNHTHRIKDAVRTRLVALQRKYRGSITKSNNPGLTVWKLS